MHFRGLIKTVSIVVLITFSFQTIVSANPDILARSANNADCLAPELRTRYNPEMLEMQMLLADLGEKALNARVLPERLEDFIKDNPACSSGRAQRFVFEKCGIDLGTGVVTIAYKDRDGVSVYNVYKKPAHIEGPMPEVPGRVQIKDIVLELEPRESSVPRGTVAGGDMPDDAYGPAGDDVTGAAEGDIAIHEAKKILIVPLWVRMLSWIPGIGVILVKKYGKYEVKGHKGVNDVIREYWTSSEMRDKKYQVPADDKRKIAEILGRSDKGRQILKSLEDNGYHIWVYDIGRMHFAGGSSTHYGIRTGNIHITKDEYERLVALGWENVAARITHEAEEIDAWRGMADRFVRDGIISERGAVEGVYDGNWENGIRKWIRDHSTPRLNGQAQEEGRKIHKKGVEAEITILVDNVLHNSEEEAATEGISAADNYKRITLLAAEFLTGDLAELIYHPATEAKVIEGRAYTDIRDALHHLYIPEYRKFFLEALYIRAVAGYVINKDGGLDELMKGENNVHNKAPELMKRMQAIKSALGEVKRIDRTTRTIIDAWLADGRNRVKTFPRNVVESLEGVSAEVQQMLSDRNHFAIEDGNSMDPHDIVASAASDDITGRFMRKVDPFIDELIDQQRRHQLETAEIGRGGDSTLMDTNTSREVREFGVERSLEICEAIVPSKEKVAKVMDVTTITALLSDRRHWGYFGQRKREKADFVNMYPIAESEGEKNDAVGKAKAALREGNRNRAALFYAQAGNFDAAVKALSTTIDSRGKDESFKQLVEWFVNNGLYEHALNTADDNIHDIDLRDEVFEKIAKELLAQERLEEARGALARMEKGPNKVNIIDKLIKGFLAERRYDDAITAAEMIPDAHPLPKDGVTLRNEKVSQIDMALRGHGEDEEEDAGASSTTFLVDRKESLLSSPFHTDDRYEFISTFDSDREIEERIKKATKSATHLLVGGRKQLPTVIRNTGNNRRIRMFFGSPTGYFEVSDLKPGQAHEIDVTVLVDGEVPYLSRPEKFVPGEEGSGLPEDIRNAIEEFNDADIKSFNIRVVGTADLRKAFYPLRDQEPGESADDYRKYVTQDVEEAANLQRLAVSLFRRDIPVAGTDKLYSISVNDELQAFEAIYVKEQVEQLLGVRKELYEKIPERKSQLPLLQLTPDEEKRIRDIETRIKTLADKAGPELNEYNRVKSEIEGLEKELKQLLHRYEEWKKLPHADRVNQVSIGSDIQMARMQKLELRAEKTRIKDELESELLKIKKEIKGLNEEKSDLERRRKEHAEAAKEIEARTLYLSRQVEVLQKLVEDAQCSSSGLMAGSVIVTEDGEEYTVAGFVGAGGVGDVYQVVNTKGQYFGLKLLKPTVSDTMSQRFRQEHQVMYHMDPVRTHSPTPYRVGIGKYSAREYFIMELIPGISLDIWLEQLRRGERYATARQKEILAWALVRTLSKFHDVKVKLPNREGTYSVIHADIKPSNFIIPTDKDGDVVIPDVADIEQASQGRGPFYTELEARIKVIDLGLCMYGASWEKEKTNFCSAAPELTQVGLSDREIAGTLGYMPLAQLVRDNEREMPNQSWDCYAMGATIYQLLAHDLPLDLPGIPLQAAAVHETTAPTPIIEKIREQNARIKTKTESHLEVDEQLLDKIRPGLTAMLASETDPRRSLIERLNIKDDELAELEAIRPEFLTETHPEKRIIEAKETERGTRYYWVPEVLDERVLTKRLSRFWEISREDLRSMRKIFRRAPKCQWIREALGDKALALRLSNYDLSAVEVEKIKGVILRTIPEVDGYIEALLNRMLSKKKEEILDAGKFAMEIQKHLDGRYDDMICGSTRKSDSFMVFVRKHMKAAVLAISALVAIGAVIVGGGWWYSRSLVNEAKREAADRIKQAEERESQAAARITETETLIKRKEAEQRGMEAQLEEIKRNKEGLQAQVDALKETAREVIALKENKDKLEADKAQLEADKIALEEQQAAIAKNVADLMAKQAELATQEKKLNADIARAEASRQQLAADLAEARAKLAKFESSITGRLEEAKSQVSNNDPAKALEVLDRIWKWSVNDPEVYKQYSAGMDGILKLMLDRGYLEEAVTLLGKRLEVERHNATSNWGGTDELRLACANAMVDTRLETARIMRLGGDLRGAFKLIQDMMEGADIKESKERQKLVDMEAAALLLESAYSDADEEARKGQLQKVMEFVEKLQDKEREYFFSAKVYLIQGRYEKAAEFFAAAHKIWMDSAAKEGIAEAEQKQLRQRAGMALVMSASVYVEQALAARRDGKGDIQKSSAEEAIKEAAAVKEKFKDHAEVLALAGAVEGEAYLLFGDRAKAEEAFRAVIEKAKGVTSDIVRAFARERLGEAEVIPGKYLDNTWTVLLVSGDDIPAFMARAIKGIVQRRTESVKLEIVREKIKADAERRRQEEEAREKEEERLRAAEEARKEQAEAEFRAQVLKGIDKLEDAQAKLVVVEKSITELAARLGAAATKAQRDRIQQQLDTENKKKKILEEAIEKMGGKREGEPRAMLPRGEKPIANTFEAPDHRLCNAIIGVAHDYRSISWEESAPDSEGIRTVLIGTPSMKSLLDVYNAMDMAEQAEVKRRYYGAIENHNRMVDTDLQSSRITLKDAALRKISAEDAETLLNDGLTRLRNISGHAGITGSKLYIVAGADQKPILLEHERMELRLHQGQAASYLHGTDGRYYTRWDQVAPHRRQEAVRELRSDPRYNEIAERFHRMADERYPVTEETEAVPDGYAAGPGYQRPIAQTDSARYRNAVLESIRTSSALLAGAVLGMFAAVSAKGQSGKGVVIFADDIVDANGTVDLESVADMVGREGKPLSRVVLYAEDEGKSEQVKNLILAKNPEAEVHVVKEADVSEYYGGEIHSNNAVTPVLRYLQSGRSGRIFRDSEEILGVIKAPARGEDMERLRGDLRRSGLRIPVVVLDSPREDRMYSMAQAIAKLFEMKHSDDIRNLVFLLPPIEKISAAMQEQYREYVDMMKALESAA